MREPRLYEQRFYRDWVARGDLVRFEVTVRESDLLILCDRPLEREARAELERVRGEIEEQIARVPRFGTALEPLPADRSATPAAARMIAASGPWAVGPMAAVAGTVAERVGARLAREASTVIVENGGDVWARSPRPVRFALYAGAGSPFAGRVAFEVDAAAGVGVCTSSGIVGPSLSFGRADAVVAIAPDAARADAAATAIANRVAGPADVGPVVDRERERGALAGLLICCGDRIGIWGELELVESN
jgi:ApbE superfamily uncharacterized protein (UPF0280 family)